MERWCDSVEIAAPPQRVWRWLTRLADNYTEWHPAHVSAGWVVGEPNTVGGVLEAVEWLGGRREVLRLQLTAIDPPRCFAYRFRGHAALVLSGGRFSIEPTPSGTRFTAEITARFGRLTRLLFRPRLTQIRRHMEQEGANLKRILESGE